MNAELRERLHHAAARPLGEPDLDDVRRRASRIRRRRAGLGAAAAALLLLVPIGVVVLREPPPDITLTEPAPDPEPEPPSVVEGTWAPLPPAPIGGRRAASGTWTGSEVLVWGGSPASEGAAYDPDDETWRLIPAAPLDGREGHVAVWTGDELVVWGGSTYPFAEGEWDGSMYQHDFVPAADGAAYDPATDTWRVLPEAPIDAAQWVTGAWTGSELLVVGHGEAAAYNPGVDAWRRLADPPADRTLASPAVFTTDELVLWGPGGGIAYDPDQDTWRDLPAAPVEDRVHHRLVWTGREVIIIGGWRYGASDPRVETVAYAPATDTWRRLADLPRGQGPGMQAVPVAGGILVVGGSEDLVHGRPMGAWRYELSDDRWTPLGESPLAGRADPVAVATPDRLVVWSGARTAAGDEIAVHGDGAVFVFDASWFPEKLGPPPLIADWAVEGLEGNQWEITTPVELIVHVTLHEPAEEIRFTLEGPGQEQHWSSSAAGMLPAGEHRLTVLVDPDVPADRYHLMAYAHSNGGYEATGLGIVVVND